MGFLDGSLATDIYEGFRGKLLTGLIRRQAAPDSGALDARGDPIDLRVTDTDCEGFFDLYDDAYLARAGIPRDSVKVCIFAKSCPGTRPQKDDLVKLVRAGVPRWFQLRRVKTDPAEALWECPDAFEIPEPSE